MERIRIAIVGLNFGRYILEYLTREPASLFLSLAAVCDLNEELSSGYAAQYGVTAYTSIEALLKDDSIPAIGIFTGPSGRADLIDLCIEAGKDVLTTKPFETDPSAARAILRKAADLGRIIHLNSPSPEPSQAIQKIWDWEKQYDLGRIVGYHGAITAPYQEKADGSWLDDPERCPVAPIFRLGIYLINDLIRLLGSVDEVQVLASRIRTGRPTPDNAQLSLLFRNGVIASVYSSFCVDDGQYYSNSFTLRFERGCIHHNTDIAEYGKAGKGSRLLLVRTENKAAVQESCFCETNMGGYQWENFYEAVSHRIIDESVIGTVVAGIEVIDAMRRAEKSGRTERVDLLAD